jgi:hypothetical protein
MTSDPLKLVYTPQILDRYPMEDRDDVSLPTGLTLFCLPDGLHVHSSQKPPSFYSFVQTSESGAQLIGCCLTFFEELNDLQRKCLYDLIDSSESSDISSSALSHLKLYVPKCLCLLSHWPFVSSFKKYLCHLYRLSLTPCRIPIERYICNFLGWKFFPSPILKLIYCMCVDDVPAPPPGLVEVSYFIGTECVIFKRPPSNEPNAWSTMPMTPLFECLSPENIIALFSLLLAERQIVLLSSQYSLLTSCSECMLSLLYPCLWTHVYIPILPRRLLGNCKVVQLMLCLVHFLFFFLLVARGAGCSPSLCGGGAHFLPSASPHRSQPPPTVHERLLHFLQVLHLRPYMFRWVRCVQL